MRIIMILFYLVLAVFGVTFAVLNAQLVDVHYYFATVKVPVSLLMVCTLALGIMLGALTYAVRFWRLKIKYNHLKGKKQQHEKNKPIPS